MAGMKVSQRMTGGAPAGGRTTVRWTASHWGRERAVLRGRESGGGEEEEKSGVEPLRSRPFS